MEFIKENIKFISIIMIIIVVIACWMNDKNEHLSNICVKTYSIRESKLGTDKIISCNNFSTVLTVPIRKNYYLKSHKNNLKIQINDGATITLKNNGTVNLPSGYTNIRIR